MSAHKYSLVIPTLNEEKALPELLGDLEGQMFRDFEVIVVDGRSEDRTKEKALKYNNFLNLRFIESKVRDVSYQRNLGVKYAESKWIIFMDADNRIKSNFLGDIKKNLSAKKDIDIFSCWMLPDDNDVFNKLIAFGTNIGSIISKLLCIPGAPGSLIGVKSEVFTDIGGFKERTYSEDWDFVSKAYKQGYKYSFFLRPSYSTSFRRFRKYGRVRVLLTSLHLTIKRLFRLPINMKKEWPMDKH